MWVNRQIAAHATPLAPRLCYSSSVFIRSIACLFAKKIYRETDDSIVLWLVNYSREHRKVARRIISRYPIAAVKYRHGTSSHFVRELPSSYNPPPFSDNREPRSSYALRQENACAISNEHCYTFSIDITKDDSETYINYNPYYSGSCTYACISSPVSRPRYTTPINDLAGRPV